MNETTVFLKPSASMFIKLKSSRASISPPDRMPPHEGGAVAAGGREADVRCEVDGEGRRSQEVTGRQLKNLKDARGR